MKNSIKAQKLNWGTIPLIDLSPWFNGNDDEKKAVAKEVISACCTTGFLYIVNHRIPQPLLEEVFKGAKAFFELPLNEKKRFLSRKQTKTVVIFLLGQKVQILRPSGMRKKHMTLPT